MRKGRSKNCQGRPPYVCFRRLIAGWSRVRGGGTEVGDKGGAGERALKKIDALESNHFRQASGWHCPSVLLREGEFLGEKGRKEGGKKGENDHKKGEIFAVVKVRI